MKNRLIAVAIGLLLLALAVPHEAAACERCGPVGFVCNADYCDYVIGCVAVHAVNSGSNDCSTDWTGCYTSGGFCQWALLVFPQGQSSLQVLPLAPNHSVS